MIYTQQFTISANNVHRLGTIGGSALVKTPDGEMQVGFIQPCRYGLIRIRPIGDNLDIFDCIANISGYSDNSIRSVKIPGDIIVELPCSVEVVGASGSAMIVEAWDMSAFNSRGACDSYVGNQTAIAIPPWATVVDFTGNICIFRNQSGGIVGTIDYLANATVVGFSIPKGASSVDITGVNAANTTLIFRQQ